jgi:hypothetical protein
MAARARLSLPAETHWDLLARTTTLEDLVGSSAR